MRIGMAYWNELFFYGFINTLPGGAGLIFTPNAPPVRIDTLSDFRWMKSLYGTTNANIRIAFQDSRLGRQATTVPAFLVDVASNFAGTPYPIPWPYYLITAGSNFIINASDASGVANVLRFVMHGAKIRAGLAPWEQDTGRWKSYKREEPFIYNSGQQTVAALSTLSFSITIENDAPFFIQNMTGGHDGALGALLVDIRDSTASDQTWSNIAIPFETIFGNAQFPNILHDAYRMVGGKGSPAILTLNVQNLAVGAINFRVNFGGLKLFE